MGKIKKGILGGFSGRVGNVIGGSWKGIDYMRSEATSIADPKTAKQLEQRSKFRVAVEFAKNCVPLINIGLKQYATKRSEYNYLVSRICKDWWDEGINNIDFANVQLSSGELSQPTNVGLTISIGQDFSVLRVNYDPITDSSLDVNFCALAYDVHANEYAYVVFPSSFDPAEGEFDWNFPKSFTEDSCYVYLFFVDRNTGNCSNTYFSEV